MIIFINARKKRITLTAQGSETDLFSLIVAFAGGAVISPKPNATLFKTMIGKIFKKIVIDMNHPTITKEFIQLLLRTKSIKTI